MFWKIHCFSKTCHKVKEFSALITDKMQLEAEEPFHEILAFWGNPLERLVYVNSLVLADMYWSAVNKDYTCTFTKKNPFDERYGYSLFQLYKMVV